MLCVFFPVGDQTFNQAASFFCFCFSCFDPFMDKEYSELLEKMGWDPVSIEQMMELTNLKAEELSSMLLLLELQGHVSSAPGGYFSRITPPE